MKTDRNGQDVDGNAYAGILIGLFVEALALAVCVAVYYWLKLS